MRVAYTINETDFLNAWECLWRSRNQGTRTAHLLGLGGAAFGALVFILVPDIRGLALALMIVGSLLALFPFLRRWLYLRAFRSNPKFHLPTEADFGEDVIVTRSEIANAELKWDLYRQVLESENAFLLMHGKQTFSLLPKRAFASDEEIVEFRSLAARKLGEPAFI